MCIFPNSLLKYAWNITSKICVRSGIWTNARLRGPEHSQRASIQARESPWVLRLRPLGYPDSCINYVLWYIFDWTTLGSLRYHSFQALPAQSLTYSFSKPCNHPLKYVQLEMLLGSVICLEGRPLFCWYKPRISL